MNKYKTLEMEAICDGIEKFVDSIPEDKVDDFLRYLRHREFDILVDKFCVVRDFLETHERKGDVEKLKDLIERDRKQLDWSVEGDLSDYLDEITSGVLSNEQIETLVAALRETARDEFVGEQHAGDEMCVMTEFLCGCEGDY